MPRKMLVAYSMSSTHVQTTLDYLTAFKHYSGYETTYLHVTHDAQIDLDFGKVGFDVVVHNYCSRFCFDGYVPDTYRSALKRFHGLKVLAIQDEYDYTNKLKEAIKEHGFQIVLTCVPQDSLPFVYPRSEFPDVEFVTVFTGYVPEGFASAHRSRLNLGGRPIVVGYRGRDIGARYGRLGFEKFEIGRRMKEICDARGVPNDIAMTESSRIYGTAWFDFVGNCRAMLGSESGSNIFDFDGTVQSEHARMAKRLGRPPSYAEFSTVVAECEKQIDMGQISPRVFECAVMRTPMVLFRGRYSDAIEAETHFIPLELDFSNAVAVLDRLQDIPALEAMAERAYEHLVASGRFGYRFFIEALVERFESRLAKLHGPASAEPQPLRTLDRRQRILSECPTDLPQGMDDFRAKQILLNGINFTDQAAQLADQAAQLDVIFQKAIEKFNRETRDLLACFSRLATRSGTSQSEATAGSGALARNDFENRMLRVSRLRQTYKEQRQNFLQQAETALKSDKDDAFNSASMEVAHLDQTWTATYANAYNELQLARRICVKAIAQDALRLFAGSPGLKAIYFASRLKTLLRGSKLEVAKVLVRMLPGGRSLALAALKLTRKRD